MTRLKMQSKEAEAIVQVRKGIEEKLQRQDEIDRAVAEALIVALDFNWLQKEPMYRIEKSKAKVVWSIVQMCSAEVRKDGRVQCWTTRATYESAKQVANELNESVGNNPLRRYAVVAQYVGKDYFIGS